MMREAKFKGDEYERRGSRSFGRRETLIARDAANARARRDKQAIGPSQLSPWKLGTQVHGRKKE